MRINVYAEETTNRVEILEKVVDGHKFFGLRFYLELPVTVPIHAADGQLLGNNVYKGPFMHKPGDDDSSAVTFWSNSLTGLRGLLLNAVDKFDVYATTKIDAALAAKGV